MSPVEIFFTFGCACICAVALLATWLRFTSKSSAAKRV